MATTQAIVTISTDLEDSLEESVLTATVLITEIRAIFQTAANQADRDNMPGTAERLRNDLKVINRFRSGDKLILF